MKIKGKFVCFIENGARLYPVKGIRPNIDFSNTIVEIETDKFYPQEKKRIKPIEYEYYRFFGKCSPSNGNLMDKINELISVYNRERKDGG